MHAVKPSSFCRSCTANLRRTSHRPRAAVRAGSSLASPKANNFAQYFFHNDRWGPLHRSHYQDASPSTPISQALTPQSSTIRAFKVSETLTPRRLLRIYAELSKSRLTVLVVLTAMAGVALSPLPTSLPVLLSTAAGTALCSASANALNQLQEVPFDAQMARTRMRPLVRRAISPLHAAGFAVVTGVAGPAVLWTMVNPITAFLGAANIALYAGAYTWLKRRNVFSTWVGAVVGALPPLMGWTACGGQLLPSSSYPIQLFLPSFLSTTTLDLHLIDNPLAPLALFMLLYSWQFPHFNSLSHLVRESYAQAGYRMLSVVSPAKNALVSLRHTLLLIPVCSVLVPISGLTTWAFAIASVIPNAIWAEAAWRFWRSGSEKHARKVFQHSLWYLPVMLGLMMFCKRGMDWGSWIGVRAEEHEEDVRE
ncbi:protoheme IX farnesyltransferase [Sparassis latifolia]|uniref:Protoheme IX farnesyltransferase, mitochondrial n=1 Tax=Sparassis crispa TaxID=139825 RepID=A0A401H220_9APHY|nr:Protoheme IX farnesyltransferase, mitochondrial [Sparassis crispa]GBE88458.1 Protoheme IX farnesyltransferase, mitochondrial [Sparassis crispa]